MAAVVFWRAGLMLKTLRGRLGLSKNPPHAAAAEP
jgi:hypothetical protein